MKLKRLARGGAGFGNAGSIITRLVAEDGARVVAACDSKAASITKMVWMFRPRLNIRRDGRAVRPKGSERDRAGRTCSKLIATSVFLRLLRQHHDEHVANVKAED